MSDRSEHARLVDDDSGVHHLGSCLLMRPTEHGSPAGRASLSWERKEVRIGAYLNSALKMKGIRLRKEDARLRFPKDLASPI